MRSIFRRNNKKSSKINYMSYKMWRSVYLISLSSVHKTSEKRIYSRSSVIPNIYKGAEILVHSGKDWSVKRVTNWVVGFKSGEFTWNRKLALYKAKQLKKKSKKK